MYNSVASSQQMLIKVCAVVNQLQSQVKEVKEAVGSVTTLGATTTEVTNGGKTKHIEHSDYVRTSLHNFATDLEVVKRDLAQLKAEHLLLASKLSNNGSSSTNGNSTTPAAGLSSGDIEALVKKECDVTAKKQRELLEALLSAKYDKMISRCVQEACDNQRRELLCKLDSSNHDTAAALEVRLQHVMQLIYQQSQVISQLTSSSSQQQAAEGQQEEDVAEADAGSDPADPTAGTQSQTQSSTQPADEVQIINAKQAPRSSTSKGRGKKTAAK
jgi:hypothetical protein